MTLRTQTLGAIVADNPAASRVFLRHRLDFCCAGHRTLADACLEAGMDVETITREIDDEQRRDSDAIAWDEAPTAELVEHIVATYHEGLRRDFPPLIDAARRVERVHAGKPKVPVGLSDFLVRCWGELQDHMLKEEVVLFPLLRAGTAASGVMMPIDVMRREHDAHGASLGQLRELTGDLQTPDHACATWAGLYDGLRVLEAELMVHIHLENNILFSRFAEGMDR